MSISSFLLHPSYYVNRKVRTILFGDITAKLKGKKGENKVARIVSQARFKSKTILLGDIFLPWPSGKTSQIDLIAITSSGIYIFEVKNYSGWIFGNEENQYWTQVLPAGYTGDSIKNKFYNPIKQNNSHIACVRKIINDYRIPIHSIIVFSDNAEFKSLSYNETKAHIVQYYGLNPLVTRIDNEFQGYLTDEYIEKVRNKLVSAHKGANSKSHNAEIKKQIKEQEECVQNGICPLCGSKLVIRTVKQGINQGKQFIGCSAYPKCHYTHNI